MDHHDWRHCRPAIATATDDPVRREEWQAATNRAWAAMTDSDKRTVHAFMCLGHRNDRGSRVMGRFETAIREQVATARQQNAQTAHQVSDFMQKLGAKVYDPEPGDEVMVVVRRVADSLVLGDNPYPELALRRTITYCSRCGEKTWIDPASHGVATPNPVCEHCFHPKLKAVLEAELADRRRLHGPGGQS